jgi:RNA polymerase sigma factor (sigma-70 family)
MIDSCDVKFVAREHLDLFLGSLTERERHIIESHFALNGHKKTLKELADIYGIHPTRVRQIEQKSLRKLHNFAEQLTKVAPALY